MSENILTLPIGLIDEPRIILRPVLRQSKEYLELCSSIEKYGLLSAVLVRPKGDRYELVAGNWRRTACVYLKKPTMPCISRPMTDEEALALQLQENAVRFDTKPAEFANQLKRLMEQSPDMTKATLAGLVCKHPNWIDQLLDLTKLSKAVQLLVDRGEMTLMNAIMLAKIPKRWRDDQIDNACRMTVAEFKSLAAGIIKQYAECIRQGKLDARFLTDFKPVGYIRKPNDIATEIADSQVGPLMIVSENCKTHLDVWKAACRWCIHLDRESIEQLRRKAEREGRLESEGDNGVDE